jgi:hypothetical protein
VKKGDKEKVCNLRIKAGLREGQWTDVRMTARLLVIGHGPDQRYRKQKRADALKGHLRTTFV